MKIAISTSSFASQDHSPLDLLKTKKVKIVQNPFSRKLNEEEIIKHLNGVDGLLAGLEPLNYRVFQKSPNLKAISRIGIGVDNIDLGAAKKLGIKISNTPDAPIDAVAEMTLTAGLALSRSIVLPNLALHKKIWRKSIGKGLKNTNVLFIGYGHIGRKTAELFRNLGSNIIVCDPAIKINDLVAGDKLMTVEEGLEIAEIVTIHAATNKTILSENEFSMMKEGVIILNSSRGNLIDEEALIHALDSGKVSSAWLDVFIQEPYDGNLTKYDQVLLTPHISTYTVQCRREMEMSAVKNLFKDLGI